MLKRTVISLKLIICFLAVSFGPDLLIGADNRGQSVVVIYNKKLADSKSVAEYYAERRKVPENQIFGYDLPTSEEMTRQEYIEQLRNPLLKDLEKNGLFKFADQNPGEGTANRSLKDATIRYAALCYGVPVKVTEDPTLVEKETASLRVELQRSECSVDSQLASLPLSLDASFTWIGPTENPLYRNTNAVRMHPTNGVLMVARLDGPTATIAKGLVDLAMNAETNGLWGRAYIDSRGMTNGPLVMGDEMMRDTFKVIRTEFPVDFDDQEATFSEGFPLSQVAIYAGWYDQSASGPFSLPKVDFMPGAFAYHLHSFTARSIRTDHGWWVGPLLAKGATATIGNVFEPYLAYTEELPLFLSLWFSRGFTFGEAAWSGIRVISWQTTMIGDPLYQPFQKSPQELHLDLEKRRPDLLPWSYLRIVTRNLAKGTPPPELSRFIEQRTPFRESSILLETLGDLKWLARRYADSLAYYEEALKREIAPPHELRLMMKLAKQRSYFGPIAKALKEYQKVLEKFPDYPGRLDIYQIILPMAREEGLDELVKECEESIAKLSADLSERQP